MAVTFDGCNVWPLDNEIVELTVGGVRYDLHNDADLTEISVSTVESSVEILLTFNARRLLVGRGLNSWDVLKVRFINVEDFHLNVNAAVSHEAGLFLAFEYRGGRSLGIYTDSSILRFDTKLVVVRRESSVVSDSAIGTESSL